MERLKDKNILIISHKEIWIDKNSPSGYSTIGGFPIQINKLSTVFNKTLLMCSLRKGPIPNSVTPLYSNNLAVEPLDEPPFNGVFRKLFFLIWFLKHSKEIFLKIKNCDIIHTLIPGDIGLVGTLIALSFGKPVFIRHCGTWGNTDTIFDKFIYWLLKRIASKRNIVMATGDGDIMPEKTNKYIKWIFSSTITKSEWENIFVASSWSKDEVLKIVVVSRLTKKKNVQSLILSFEKILSKIDSQLYIVGDGIYRPHLEELSNRLSINKYVHFYGNCKHSNVMEILSKSHLFIFPTKTKEGFPKVLLEAMASGLPCLGSDISVIPYLIGNECGKILKEPEPNFITDAVFELTSNPKLMRNMSLQARAKSEYYTIDNWCDLISSRLKKSWSLD